MNIGFSENFSLEMKISGPMTPRAVVEFFEMVFGGEIIDGCARTPHLQLKAEPSVTEGSATVMARRASQQELPFSTVFQFLSAAQSLSDLGYKIEENLLQHNFKIGSVCPNDQTPNRRSTAGPFIYGATSDGRGTTCYQWQGGRAGNIS